MKIIFKLALFFLCLLISTAQARENEPFMAKIKIADQSLENRQKAIFSGLKQVIKKNSTKANTLNRVSIKSALKKSKYYMQQYYYATEQASTDDDSAQKFIYILYDADAVKNLIENNGKKVKPPLKVTDIMTWFVVIDTLQPPRLLGMEDFLLQQFQQSATKSRLNLLLPLLDLEDQANISSEAIIDLNPRLILNASIRYQVALNLAIKYSVNDDQVSIDATLLSPQKKYWHYQADTSNAVFDKLNQALSDYLARTTAPKKLTLNSGNYQLTINNVSNAPDYFRIQQYFSTAPPIAHFQIKEMTGSKVVLILQLKKDLHDLVNQTDFNRLFQIESQTDNNKKMTLKLNPEIIEQMPESELIPVMIDKNHE